MEPNGKAGIEDAPQTAPYRDQERQTVFALQQSQSPSKRTAVTVVTCTQRVDTSRPTTDPTAAARRTVTAHADAPVPPRDRLRPAPRSRPAESGARPRSQPRGVRRGRTRERRAAPHGPGRRRRTGRARGGRTSRARPGSPARLGRVGRCRDECRGGASPGTRHPAQPAAAEPDRPCGTVGAPRPARPPGCLLTPVRPEPAADASPARRPSPRGSDPGCRRTPVSPGRRGPRRGHGRRRGRPRR